MVGVWQSVVRELDGSVCIRSHACMCVWDTRACVCVGFDDIALAVPPTESLFLACQSYPPSGRSLLSRSFARRRSSSNSRRPSPTHACSTHIRRVSLPLDPFLFLPRVSVALSSSSLTITSLSLVDPPSPSRPSRRLLSWQPGHAHTHTHTRTRVAPGRSVSRDFGFDTLEREREERTPDTYVEFHRRISLLPKTDSEI